MARRQRHQRDVDEFIARGLKGTTLLGLIRDSGVTDGDQMARFLAALPAETQLRLGIPCLGDAVVGAPHTCRWEPAEIHPTAARI